MSVLTPSSKTAPSMLAGIVGILLTVALALAYWFGLFDSLELRSYDLRFRGRGPLPARPELLLITIDETTAQTLGGKISAISRADHAQVIENLTRRGAKLIVYDLDFSRLSPPGEEDSDYLLQQALVRSGRVILPRFISQGDWVRPEEMFRQAPVMVNDAVARWTEHGIPDEEGNMVIFWSPSGTEAESWWVFASPQPFSDPEAEGVVPLAAVPAGRHFLQVSNLEPRVKYYFLVVGRRKVNPLVGEASTQELPDADGRIRRLPLLVQVPLDQEKVPTLALAAALALLWPDQPPQECSFGPDQFCLKGQGRELRIPLQQGNFLINFIGPAGTFPRLSFSQVLSQEVEPGAKPDLEGKIVLVGFTHPASQDNYLTPFSRTDSGEAESALDSTRPGDTSGLEIHAHALQTLLDQAFLHTQIPRRVAGLILVLGTLLTVLFVVLRPSSRGGVLVLLGSLAGLALFAYYLFAYNHYWLVVTPLLLTAGLTFLGILAIQALGEYRQKETLKAALSPYLAPTVMDKLAHKPDPISLDGEIRQLSVLCSDLQGLSLLPEKLAPQQLILQLNEYLSAMGEVIFEFEGAIAKLEGDAIKAFFGAPLDQPDHARRACLAALAMQKRNAELRAQWEAEGKPALASRIGLNTGPLLVGNIGPAQRLHWTVLGANADLASRLLEAGRRWGVSLLLTEFTYQPAEDAIEVRELGRITAAGRDRPVRVYELLARKGELDEKTREVLAAFAQGLALYRERKWDQAMAQFQAAIRLRGEDLPSQVYLKRCRQFLANPPVADEPDEFPLDQY